VEDVYSPGHAMFARVNYFVEEAIKGGGEVAKKKVG